MALNREQVRAASKRAIKVDEVEIEEFGGSIRLRQLTAGELAEYQTAAVKHQADGTETEAIFVLLQMAGVDDNDARLWPDQDGLTDIRALPSSILETLAKRAAALNGVTEETIAEAAKN